MADWSEWKDLYLIDVHWTPYQWPGVYEIRLADQKGQPIGLSRFLDVDVEGLLVIGESANVATRLRDYYRASKGGASAHSEAERMYLIGLKTSFQKSVYKGSKVQFRWMRLKDKAEAETYEERLLKTYFKRFGELPPLNSEMPRKHIDWRDI